MPIYAYRCEHCGHAKDVLRKISDPVLTVCPACGEPTFRKQVTAAGFQLKGSGWYVTDFKGDKPAGKKADAEDKSDAKDGEAKPAEAKGGDGATTEPAKANGSGEGAKASKPDGPSPAAAPAASSPAPAPSSGPTGGRQP
jgi:putative FmdB family regulatory protein